MNKILLKENQLGLKMNEFEKNLLNGNLLGLKMFECEKALLVSE